MTQVYKNGRILQKVDTEENWTANDPVILKGEMCVSTFEDGSVKVKIAGEHGLHWSEIDYLKTGGSDAKPDWNVNDEEEPGYIENRTHYKEPIKTVYYSHALETYIDENEHIKFTIRLPYEDIRMTTDTVTKFYLQIGDVVLNFTNGGGSTLGMSGGFSIPSIFLIDGETVLGGGGGGYSNGFMSSGAGYNGAGREETDDTTLWPFATDALVQFYKLEYDVTTLDEEYLPISAPDWNASNGSKGFIENRTHYVYDINQFSEVVKFDENGYLDKSEGSYHEYFFDPIVPFKTGATYKVAIGDEWKFNFTVSGADDSSAGGGGNGNEICGWSLSWNINGLADKPTKTAKISITSTSCKQYLNGFEVQLLAEAVEKLNEKFLPEGLALKHLRDGNASGSLRGINSAEESSDYSLGTNAVAVGYKSKAIGYGSFAEGNSTVASGNFSRAEGTQTTASGYAAHSEGGDTLAKGDYSHAEGNYGHAYGYCSHAEGQANMLSTITLTKCSISGKDPYNSNTVTFNFYINSANNTTDYRYKRFYYNDISYSINAAVYDPYNNRTLLSIYKTDNSYQPFVISGDTVQIQFASSQVSDSAGHTEGCRTSAGYCSHSEGQDTFATASSAHSEGQYSKSIGFASHTEGQGSTAVGSTAHAEGQYTFVQGYNAHAEGQYTLAAKQMAHIEGQGQTNDVTLTYYGTAKKFRARGDYRNFVNWWVVYQNKAYQIENVEITGSASYPYSTFTINIDLSHVRIDLEQWREDYYEEWGEYPEEEQPDYNISVTFYRSFACANAHAEGMYTRAIGDMSHAEGNDNTALGQVSHVEGMQNMTIGNYSHAEGYNNVASGSDSHAEGHNTIAFGNYSHAEGSDLSSGSSVTLTYVSANTFKIYDYNKTYVKYAGTVIRVAPTSNYLWSGVYKTATITSATNANDYTTFVINGVSDYNTNIKAVFSAHQAIGMCSHAEGEATIAKSSGSHSEGGQTIASGNYSHAEGYYTNANGNYSHSEGNYTTTGAQSAHSEGDHTTAGGKYSHSEGYYTTANGEYSHAEGNYTIAASSTQHVFGAYNIEDNFASGVQDWVAGTSYAINDLVVYENCLYKCAIANSLNYWSSYNWTNLGTKGEYIEIVGNGTSTSARSNARTLDWYGNEWIAGNLAVNGNTLTVNGEQVATLNQIPLYTSELINDGDGGSPASRFVEACEFGLEDGELDEIFS